MRLTCLRCDRDYALDPLRFRCECGGPLEVTGAPTFDPARVDATDGTLWRYRHALPLSPETPAVTLGEGNTPLVETRWDDLPILLKCESLNPTGSFKDRGTTVLVTALAGKGVGTVVEDSSGNAGASLAAYAARAGIQAQVYVPAHASPVKQAQIAAYGAEVVAVPGPRAEAARAVLEAASAGAAYASHVYHPLIHHGMKTTAFDICEQLAGSQPDAVVLPVGHGSLLLGLVVGFDELRAAGVIERTPRLFGVQASACAPLAAAFQRGDREPTAVTEGDTVAGGVRIADPPRGREILAEVRRSRGVLLAVEDEEAMAAQRRLAHQGFYVEPTSALAVAALDHLRHRLEGMVVVMLTGSGFKTPPGDLEQ